LESHRTIYSVKILIENKLRSERKMNMLRNKNNNMRFNNPLRIIFIEFSSTQLDGTYTAKPKKKKHLYDTDHLNIFLIERYIHFSNL